MADTTFKFKRGASGGSSPSGLTHGELAVNTTDNRLFVGSVTGSVNAINNRFFTGISTPSYPIEGDRWYTGTEEKFYYNGNWVTAGGASGSSGSSFDPTQLLVFNSGVSGSGGATFAGGTRFYGGAIVQSGGLSVTDGATITGGVALYGTITVNGAPIISNVPLASSSATGVASFGNEFVVSAAGAVSLTSNNVISVNGKTGNVGLPLASSSATGVASFGNEFSVSNLGAVGLTSNYVISVNGRTGNVVLPLASSSATGVASFGNQFVVSNAGAVSLTSNYVISVNGITGSVTGIATTGSNTFMGLQTLNAGLTTNHLYVTNGATFANGLVVQAGGISITGGLNVSSGTITGTLATAAQPNITSVGTLTRLDVGSGGISSAGGITGTLNTIAQPNITSVGTLTRLDVGSGGISSAGGITGTLNTAAQPRITLVGTLTSLTASGLGVFNAGITSNHLYVSNGATFANGLIVQAGGISITGGATLTGGVAVYGGLNVSSGTISGTLATAAQTNITSVGTLTKLEVGSGGISSAGGITGTLNTAAQPNITSVGTLTSLTASGLGTFNAGITSNHLYVSNGVTFASTSVHTGLGAFNAGITSNHLYVSNGATFTGSVSAISISAAVSGNASTATTLQNPRTINQTSFNGSSNITIDQMFRADKRHISPTGPSGVPAGYSQFVFTTWNNNNTSPYADGIHFRTYQDSSGGKDNLLVLNKSVIGMRLWQQEFGSATAYTSYKDVAFIQDVVTSFNGLTGAVSGVTTSAANTFTALNTFNGGISVASGATFIGTSFSTGIATPATFNGGLVSNTLVVISGVTFGGNQGTYHAGLGTFNAGITSSHLYVTSGATFASGLSVTGGTAYFFRDVYLATGANHPGIVDYEFAANTGITYPSASTPAYTVGDKWSNGSIEYTWNGSAWIENTDNIVSSTPIDFNSIVPSQSITPAKLSPGGPDWDGSYFNTNSHIVIRDGNDLYLEASRQTFPAFTLAGRLSSISNNRLDLVAGTRPSTSNSLGINSGIRLTGLTTYSETGAPPKVEMAGNVHIVAPREIGYGQGGTGNLYINGNLQCTGNSLLVGNVSIGGNVTTSGNIVASGSAHDLNGYPILQNVVGEMAFIMVNPSTYNENVCGIYPSVTNSSTSATTVGGTMRAANTTLTMGSAGTIAYTSFGGTTTWSRSTTPYLLRPSQGTWTLLVTSTGVSYYSIVAIRIA